MEKAQELATQVSIIFPQTTRIITKRFKSQYLFYFTTIIPLKAREPFDQIPQTLGRDQPSVSGSPLWFLFSTTTQHCPLLMLINTAIISYDQSLSGEIQSIFVLCWNSIQLCMRTTTTKTRTRINPTQDSDIIWLYYTA